MPRGRERRAAPYCRIGALHATLPSRHARDLVVSGLMVRVPRLLRQQRGRDPLLPATLRAAQESPEIPALRAAGSNRHEAFCHLYSGGFLTHILPKAVGTIFCLCMASLFVDTAAALILAGSRRLTAAHTVDRWRLARLAGWRVPVASWEPLIAASIV